MAEGHAKDHDQEPKRWKPLPHSSVAILCERMVQMYWEGVEREVRLLIETLRDWQQAQYEEVRGEDEALDWDSMRGFQTFVGRAVGETVKVNVRNSIQETLRLAERYPRRLSTDQRRAQLLLQASGFLDIDKLVEYRAPIDFGLWARPQAPQLAVASYSPDTYIPNFVPAECSRKACSKAIRGVNFRCVGRCLCAEHDSSSEEPFIICETCMRNGVHQFEDRRSTLRKEPKRCILREAVPQSRSLQICTCPDRRQATAENEFEFAIDGGRVHLQQCPIRTLKRRYEQARFDELMEQKVKSDKEREELEKNKISSQLLASVLKSRPLDTPLGNTHTSIMVGTIIIENGVDNTKAGALISIRQPLQMTMKYEAPEVMDSLLCVGRKRKIFEKVDEPPKRRYKACMKQVVGGAFTGLSDHTMELNIINDLVAKSHWCTMDPMDPVSSENRRLAQATKELTNSLRVLLASRVQKYFEVIASKLFSVELKWNPLSNSCQTFCSNILDYQTFGSFLATTATCRLHVPLNPLYLLSFTCPAGSYDTPKPVRPENKNHAPNGLTEEYLLQFRRHGHHQESDMFDTLLEYWHDWGAFGSTLYRHQGLFPWDCTEAYQLGDGTATNYPKCNDCNIARHVWAFPFDAFSLTKLHLLRSRDMYAPIQGSTRRDLSDPDWMRNRLSVLSALQALTTVGVALASSPKFRTRCRWNRERALLAADERTSITATGPLRGTRIKLAGIHRAQPKSHAFEKSKYHDCELASWALKSRREQQVDYEKLRDRRALEEINVPPLTEQERVRKKHSYRRRESEGKGETENERGFPEGLIGSRHDDGSNTHTANEQSRENDEDAEEWEYEDNIEEDPDGDYGGGFIPDGISDDGDHVNPLCQCGDGDDDDEPNWDVNDRDDSVKCDETDHQIQESDRTTGDGFGSVKETHGGPIFVPVPYEDYPMEDDREPGWPEEYPDSQPDANPFPIENIPINNCQEFHDSNSVPLNRGFNDFNQQGIADFLSGGEDFSAQIESLTSGNDGNGLGDQIYDLSGFYDGIRGQDFDNSDFYDDFGVQDNADTGFQDDTWTGDDGGYDSNW